MESSVFVSTLHLCYANISILLCDVAFFCSFCCCCYFMFLKWIEGGSMGCNFFFCVACNKIDKFLNINLLMIREWIYCQYWQWCYCMECISFSLMSIRSVEMHWIRWNQWNINDLPIRCEMNSRSRIRSSSRLYTSISYSCKLLSENVLIVCRVKNITTLYYLLFRRINGIYIS